MRLSVRQTKRAVSLLLCLAVLLSMMAFALTVRAEEADELADTGADTYYLWGENSNSPNFNSNTPTGTFTYDSTKGYYYYDLSGATGDYCFVVSTIGNSASYAVKTPAVQHAAQSGSYYLAAGNYHGFNCFHLWNPSGDTVRLYFTSVSTGMNAVKAGADSPTQAPTQRPTQAPTSGGVTPTTPSPTQQTPTSSSGSDGKTYVYCENEAGWGSVYAYMWTKDPKKENNAWPGKPMTRIGTTDVWRYEVPSGISWDWIIFNGNSAPQTSDLTYPADGNMYNNATKSWGVYDTSPLQVLNFGTDVDSPQFDGVGINLNAYAEGQGTVYYKFSVTKGSNTTVLSDFSTKSSVQWIPQTAGDYTLNFDFRDAAGNINKRTKSFTIESGLESVAPYIKTVTPAGGQIKRATSVNLKVSAGGGFTGTNLLFYKYTVRNSSGTIVNVPYYTRNTSYNLTCASLGQYTVTVSVQGSDNKVDERVYDFECVGSIAPTDAPETQPPTQPATQGATQAPTQKPTQAPTQPPTESGTPPIMLGDADEDEEVTISDVTWIQRYDIGIPLSTPINLLNADVDFDEEVTITDATWIQRYLVGIITEFKRR